MPSTPEVEDTEDGRDAETVKKATFVTGPNEAMSAVHPARVGLVVKPKLAVIDPAGTLTVAGTSIPGLLDKRVMVAPVPAAASDTVQFPGLPGTRAFVAHTRDERLTGVVADFKDRTAVADVDPREAVMVAL